MHRLQLRVVVPLLLVACPGPETVTTTGEPDTGEETSSTGGGTPTTGQPTTETPDTTGTPGETTMGAESTGPMAPPVCGNGFPEGDEPCDDGNDDLDDGCDKSCARTGVPIWTQSWDSGAKKDDTGNRVVLDADGNIYVAGSIEKADLLSDAAVRKLDPEGNELATFEYAGQLGLDDYGWGVAVGADGSVFLTGVETLVDDGPQQSFVRKFAADGEVVWTYTQASMYVDGYSVMYAIAVDGDTIYVAGSEETDDKVYATYVHRLDPDDGQPVWSAELEALGFNAHGLAIAPGGDAVLATREVGPNNTAVPMVARLAAADGEVLWTRAFPGAGAARGVAVNADGDIAATGLMVGEFDDADLWAARLTADGEIVWSNKFDYNHKDDVGASIVWSPAGDLYVGGYVIVPADLNDAYVQRLTGDGDVYWYSIHGGEAGLYDSVSGVALGADRLVVVGSEGVIGMGSNQWIRAYEP